MIAGPTSAALTGAVLGLSAGLSPGPLLALIIVQSLAYSVREGVKVAVAPLLTDLPIMAAALGLTFAAAGHPRLLGALTLCGAVFLTKCAWDALRVVRPAADRPSEPPRSVRKGLLANFLNPSPYLFWGAAGAPLLAQCWDAGRGSAAAFVAGFYGCLVGSQVLTAWLAGRLGPTLGGRAYVVLLRAMGGVLAVCALLLCRDAWRLLTT